MSTYSWQLPAPPTVAPPSNGSGQAASGAYASSTADLNGQLDAAFDPLTLDLIDTDDGGILETTDSRTAVLWQMESVYNAWWGDPRVGSRLREILSAEGDREPPEMIEIIDETKRCLQPLVDDGLISQLLVAEDADDQTGAPAALLTYRDPSSGHPADIAFVPFPP